MKRITFFLAGILLTLCPLFPQNRSFDDIFPLLKESQKKEAFSEIGIIRSPKSGEDMELSPVPNSGIDLPNMILSKKFPYLTESLLVVPYRGNPLRILDAYNALGKIRDLKGRVYHSHTRDSDIPLFEDAVRLESAKKNNPIPDPPPAASLPSLDTVYIRLKDVNFGNSFYRAEISPNGRGLLFYLTNYKTISYLLFPVMKEEKFIAYLYMEPLKEGMLVYSVAGTDVSDFISKKIHVPSAISKRLAIFIDWISEGLRQF